MTTNEYVLVIFPSCCNDARSAKIVSVARKRLALKDISIRKIIYEKKYVVVEVNNLVDAMSSLSEIYGIDRVAIARKVKSQFQDLIDCIVKMPKSIL
jgi:adenylyl- and sulfurtransferase ThiI